MNPAALSDRLLDFSARVGKVVDSLPRKRLANHIAAQLLPQPRLTKLLDECEQLDKIVGKSIVTAEANADK